MKVLAENKVETKSETERINSDSIVAGLITASVADATLENETRTEESLNNEPVQKNTEALPGKGNALAESATAEDVPDNYATMTATGGASNVAPSFYNPQYRGKISTGTISDSVFTFNTDKYVSDDASGYDANQKTLSMVEVQTASKNKSADNKAKKEADKKARETASESDGDQEAPAVAYDPLKVAEAKEEVEQGRRKVEDEAAANDKVYAFVDQMPQYPGGAEVLKKEIAQKISYPQLAKEQGISGTVYISYVIDAAGKVTKVKVWKSVNKELDNEAIRVISSLKGFKSGTQEGKAVPVQMSIPVHFNLQ